MLGSAIASMLLSTVPSGAETSMRSAVSAAAGAR